MKVPQKLGGCEVHSLEPECLESDCRPCRSIHNREILETQSQDYMYLACVRFVKQAREPPLFPPLLLPANSLACR